MYLHLLLMRRLPTRVPCLLICGEAMRETVSDKMGICSRTRECSIMVCRDTIPPMCITLFSMRMLLLLGSLAKEMSTCASSCQSLNSWDSSRWLRKRWYPHLTSKNAGYSTSARVTDKKEQTEKHVYTRFPAPVAWSLVHLAEDAVTLTCQ